MAKPFDDLLLTPLQRKVKELKTQARGLRERRRLATEELALNIIARQNGHISWKAMLEYLKSEYEGD